MAEIQVNPTRMELKKLKGKLATARRGHKLLKDKRDELMRQFIDVVKEAKALRASLCERFADAGEGLAQSAAEVDIRMLTEALMIPSTSGEVVVGQRNAMSVSIPTFRYAGTSRNAGPGYGFAFTSGEMDQTIEAVCDAAQEMVHLAELEKAAELMSDEIERTRRRVNALEYIMIPRYEAAIRKITMKLDENERGNQTRLMKVKDMMVEASMLTQRAADAETEFFETEEENV